MQKLQQLFILLINSLLIMSHDKYVKIIHKK